MKSGFPTITEKKAITQARVGAQIIGACLGEALILKQPADRCLRDKFRANHQLGSRDRRVINSTFFAVLRWWGHLMPLLPKNFVDAWRNGDNTIPEIADEEWYGALAAALHLDAPKADICQAGQYWEANAKASDVAPLKDLRLLVPEWLENQISSDLDRPLDELIAWQQKRPPVWLRMQCHDEEGLIRGLAEDEIPTAKGNVLPHSLRILSENNFNLKNQKNFRNGEYEIQDLGSQCVGAICSAKAGEQWWDTCAGSGGKTLMLAWMMNGKGSVVASDMRTFKLEELKLRARRAHFPNIRTCEWKGKDMPKFRGRFDGVLVDAPCTCSGTWRRNPGGRWTISEAEIGEFPPLQLQLLENAAAGVKTGGILVYSTCSMFECENRGVVKEFLKRHPEFRLVPFVNPLTGETNDGCNQVWPWQGDCDAMFTAKFQRV